MIGVIASVVVVGVVVAVLVVCFLRERDTHRRLSALVASVPGAPLAPGESSIEGLLVAVERGVRRLVADRADAEEDASLMRAAIEGIPHAVLIFGMDGSLIESNSSAAPFLGARHGDALVGAAVSEVVDLAGRDGVATTTIELFGPPRRAVDVTAASIGLESSAVVATVMDVTERHHLEEVRTDLVANISHELKTPVGAIGVLAETLEDEADPEVVSRLAARINAEALRLAAIVDDLLDLSSIEASTGTSMVTLALDSVLAEAIDRHAAASERAGVTLVPRIVDPTTAVLGDRSQLVSAVANLLDNALKYSDPGTEVEVCLEGDDGEVWLTVSDHGIGIPSRDLDRIFERFYRVDQARSRITGGSGLGLSIVRHVVANHGGRVEVRSRLGEGSTFVIILPRAASSLGSATTMAKVTR